MSNHHLGQISELGLRAVRSAVIMATRQTPAPCDGASESLRGVCGKVKGGRVGCLTTDNRQCYMDDGFSSIQLNTLLKSVWSARVLMINKYCKRVSVSIKHRSSAKLPTSSSFSHTPRIALVYTMFSAVENSWKLAASSFSHQHAKHSKFSRTSKLTDGRHVVHVFAEERSERVKLSSMRFRCPKILSLIGDQRRPRREEHRVRTVRSMSELSVQ
jgi:hypothetical protein